jgi:hypothetical protein
MIAVFLISAIVFLVYMFKPGVIQASDSTWSPHVVASLIYDQDLYLDEYYHWLDIMDFFGVTKVGDRFLPYFPTGGSVLAVPQMVILDALLPELRETSLQDYLATNGPHNPFILKLQLINASLMVALSAGVMFLIGREYLRTPYSILLTVTYAFATSTYSTASRAMWQHGPSMLLLAIALLILVKARHRPQIVAFAALPLTAAYIVRPTNSISLIILTLYVLFRYREQFLRYVLLAMLLAVPFLISNMVLFNALLPPYFAASRLGSLTISEALAGMLISPSRGLFIFSPILLLAIYGIILKRFRYGLEPLDWALILILVLHWVVVSAFVHWWGGHSYGPRFFTDIMPFIVYFLIPVLSLIELKYESTGIRVGLSSLYAVLLLLSVLIHYRGATSVAAYNWNSVPDNIDRNPQRIWDWSDPQFLRGLGQHLIAITHDQLIADPTKTNSAQPLAIIIGSMSDDPLQISLLLPSRVTFTEVSAQLFDIEFLPDGGQIARLLEPLTDELGMQSFEIRIDITGTGEPGSISGIGVIASKQNPDQTYSEDINIIPLTTGPQLATTQSLPPDIVIECDNQISGDMYALFGPGWYEEEGDGDSTWRWAASPAYLYIWSDSEQTISMELMILSNIGDNLEDSPGNRSSLLLHLPDGNHLTRNLQSGQALQFEVPLHDGWNPLILESSAGNIRPADVTPGYTDLRNLSYLTDWIHLSGSCKPAGD